MIVDLRMKKRAYLCNVVSNAWNVRVLPLEVLLVDLADALHALVHALVVAVSSERKSNILKENLISYF